MYFIPNLSKFLFSHHNITYVHVMCVVYKVVWFSLVFQLTAFVCPSFNCITWHSWTRDECNLSINVHICHMHSLFIEDTRNKKFEQNGDCSILINIDHVLFASLVFGPKFAYTSYSTYKRKTGSIGMGLKHFFLLPIQWID